MDWYIVIKVLNSTVSRSRLRIARPEVTFFEMCSTCAVQSRDLSIIRANHFVVSTLLISKLPTLIELIHC
jgi:hypothetical protein